MGQPDQFAKRTFALETARITHGAIAWSDAPELRFVSTQADGLFTVRHPEAMPALAAPWPEASGHAEVLVEIKMAGDHLDAATLQRALLRRQARQVQRTEAVKPPWRGEQPLWIVAPHVPEVLSEIRVLQEFAPGCHRVGPSAFPFVWVAANELPLRDELVPFLVARSGRALDEFARWVAPRRPLAWVLDMVISTAMSSSIREELLRTIPPTDDPEVLARRRHVAKLLLETDPDLQDQVHGEGRVIEARTLLRRVLATRKLEVSAELEAKIDACEDPVTLERWHDQAIVATSADEALR